MGIKFKNVEILLPEVWVFWSLLTVSFGLHVRTEAMKPQFIVVLLENTSWFFFHDYDSYAMLLSVICAIKLINISLICTRLNMHEYAVIRYV
jgi:hypothetical protein